MTAVQAKQIEYALGTNVLEITERISSIIDNGCEPSPLLWRELLAALRSEHPDLMTEGKGRDFENSIEEKINAARVTDDGPF